MDLTSQGYYNLIIDVAEPEELHELFRPIEPGEEFGRIDDVETAITFINDTLNADNFKHLDGFKDMTQELLMKGYVLETIRFDILREDWEPMFSPLPNNPLEHYDPDVVVRDEDTSNKDINARIKLREIPSELQPREDPITISVHDRRFIETSEPNFWIRSLDIYVEADKLKEVLDEFHQEASEQYRLDVAHELREKLTKLYEKASIIVDGIE